MVVNEILLQFEQRGIKATAYADDVVILVSGKFLPTIVELMESALSMLVNWSESCGLGVNPSKTELVLFTRKYKIPTYIPPKIRGVPLIASGKAKYLGVIMDSKLNWKDNLDERIKKACNSFYACKKAFGCKWGLTPKVVHWMYTAIVRPILMHGILVWWPALEKISYLKGLTKIQRTACIGITGALRTTPTAALETILYLIPLDIFGRLLATKSALRLKETGLWRSRGAGHARVLERSLIPISTDYISPLVNFEKKFSVLIPSRIDWANNSVFPVSQVEIYTDGSKMDAGSGAGVYSHDLNINLSFHLPEYASVFQAEILAILKAAKWVEMNPIPSTDIVVFIDSQAAIKALNSVLIKSKLVKSCLESLNAIGEQHNITLCWVPGHCDIPGNEKADELARMGSQQQGQTVPDIFAPLQSVYHDLLIKAIESSDQRWRNLPTCRTAQQLWPVWEKRKSVSIINLSRNSTRLILGVITGHCPIGQHARRIGLSSNDFCRSCKEEEEEETIEHLLCSCPALANTRLSTLGSRFFDSLGEASRVDIKKLRDFIHSISWFR